MTTLNTLLLILMVPVASANPFLYGRVANWRRSFEGRTIMWLLVALAFLVDFAVLYRVVPNFPAKPYISAVVFAALLFGFTRFAYMTIRELVAQRRRDRV